MKFFVAFIAIFIFVAGTALAMENQDDGKDWCLLGIAGKCYGTTTIDLVDKIKRLETALQRGTSVYTPEEIQHLKNMLEEARETKEMLLNRR